MLDWYSDIYCTIKMLSKRGDDINDLDLSELVSWEELTDTYNGAYKIDCTFTLALNTGELLKGIHMLGPNHFCLII